MKVNYNLSVDILTLDDTNRGEVSKYWYSRFCLKCGVRGGVIRDGIMRYTSGLDIISSADSLLARVYFPSTSAVETRVIQHGSRGKACRILCLLPLRAGAARLSLDSSRSSRVENFQLDSSWTNYLGLCSIIVYSLWEIPDDRHPGPRQLHKNSWDFLSLGAL